MKADGEGFDLLLAQQGSAFAGRAQASSWPQTKERKMKHKRSHTVPKLATALLTNVQLSGAFSLSQSRSDYR